MIFRVLITILLSCFIGFSSEAQTNFDDIEYQTDSRLSDYDTIARIKNYKPAIVISSYSATYIGFMSYLQYVWYKDHDRVPFHLYNDLKGYKQIDKMGHLYGAYMESYIGFKSLVWAGVPRREAAIFGGSMGFFLQLPIEIWDGIYEGWGFSWSDVGANFLGSALVIGQELAFEQQLVKYKFSFYPVAICKDGQWLSRHGFRPIALRL